MLLLTILIQTLVNNLFSKIKLCINPWWIIHLIQILWILHFIKWTTHSNTYLNHIWLGNSPHRLQVNNKFILNTSHKLLSNNDSICIIYQLILIKMSLKLNSSNRIMTIIDEWIQRFILIKVNSIYLSNVKISPLQILLSSNDFLM